MSLTRPYSKRQRQRAEEAIARSDPPFSILDEYWSDRATSNRSELHIGCCRPTPAKEHAKHAPMHAYATRHDDKETWRKENRHATSSGAAENREIGALDLYDADGFLIERFDLAGDHQSLAIDLAHIIPRLLAGPCSTVILRHRHPSGRAEPSEADIMTTRAFAGLVRLLGIRLHDHLIQGAGTCFSFRDEGLV